MNTLHLTAAIAISLYTLVFILEITKRKELVDGDRVLLLFSILATSVLWGLYFN
jgi:hypothetical protein